MSTNKRWILGGIGWTVLVTVFVLVLSHYEAQPDEELLGPRESLVNYEWLSNNFGQRVTLVPYRELGNWVREHNNTKIVSLVSVNDGTYGHTTAFIVVYEAEVTVGATKITED